MNVVFSFVIPHKNCPELLDRCLNTIPIREDVEIIVVDDNSEEGQTPIISRKGLRVILLDSSQSNGAGRARNIGLKYAKGKWVLFADADDCYTDYLPVLLNKYKDSENVDIVYLNACVFDEYGTESPFKTEKLIFNYLRGGGDAEKKLRYELWTPWSRMVKKSILDVNTILFDELPAGNDVMFGLKSSRYSNNIQVEPHVVYRYFKPREGSSTDYARKQMVDSRLDLKGRLLEFYKDVEYRSSTNLLDVIFSYYRNGECSVRDAIRKYQEYLKKYNVSLRSDIFFFLKNRWLLFINRNER